MQDWISQTVLENEFVRLSPLLPEHAEDLLKAATPDTFRHFSRGPTPWTTDGMQAFIEFLLGPARTVPFCIADPASGQPIGITTYLDIRPLHRGLEIGWTWIAQSHRGTRTNPAMKLLMLEHAFEQRDAIRVCLKTDERNKRSQAAIAKIGATREGVLRHAVIMTDGFRRSTVMYSILADEWPSVREGLSSRLSN
jgi:N-acetyltransferase